MSLHIRFPLLYIHFIMKSLEGQREVNISVYGVIIS